MNLGGDNDRFCYLRSTMLRKALTDPRVLDGLLDLLRVPGKTLATLKALPSEAKLRAIEEQAENLRRAKTSIWHEAKPAEIVAAEMYRTSLPRKVVRDGYFSGVVRESDLRGPVAAWLRSRKRTPYAEIPLGPNRADLLGVRADWWETAFVAIELKNDLAELARAHDQMTTYAAYAHHVYLACTPALAAAYLWRHAKGRGVSRWDAQALDNKLAAAGIGLLLVEGQAVQPVRQPRANSPSESKIEELKRAIVAAKPLDP